VPGAPVPVCFSTAVRDPQAPSGVLAPSIVFDRDEIAALVVAAQSDRVWRKELLGFCFEKWRRPALRIDLNDAMGGAVPVAPMPAWSVGEVLARLGATLVRVELPHADAATAGLPRAA
jgi:hypothetical protein